MDGGIDGVLGRVKRGFRGRRRGGQNAEMQRKRVGALPRLKIDHFVVATTARPSYRVKLADPQGFACPEVRLLLCRRHAKRDLTLCPERERSAQRGEGLARKVAKHSPLSTSPALHGGTTNNLCSTEVINLEPPVGAHPW